MSLLNASHHHDRQCTSCGDYFECTGCGDLGNRGLCDFCRCEKCESAPIADKDGTLCQDCLNASADATYERLKDSDHAA